MSPRTDRSPQGLTTQRVGGSLALTRFCCPLLRIYGHRHRRWAGSSHWLSDEDRDSPGGLRLVFLVGWICRDGKLPQPCPFGIVTNLADAHGVDLGMVPDLDLVVGGQVVHPGRVGGRHDRRAQANIL